MVKSSSPPISPPLRAAGNCWAATPNGACRTTHCDQTAEREFIRALIGDKSWTDYTLTLKARKISGREGFLVLFHIMGDEDRVWWNIDGWNNTQNAVSGSTLDGKRGFDQAGRWYDIRIEVRGDRVKCFLDGQLIHDINYHRGGNVKALYACASRDDKTGDFIVKVVNASANSSRPPLTCPAQNLAGTAQATVLTSEEPFDENSIDDPKKISPKIEPVTFTGTTLTRMFTGNSFTVLRFPTAK